MYIWLLPISPDKKLFVGLMGMYQNIYILKISRWGNIFLTTKNYHSTILNRFPSSLFTNLVTKVHTEFYIIAERYQ